MRYSNIIRNTNPKAYKGGYKNVFFFARRDEFLLLKKPTSAGAIKGDTLAIVEAHTFTSPNGFTSWACKTNSVTITAETTGDVGAKLLSWTCVFGVLGDSASNQEQMQATLNDDLICLLKEGACLNADEYVQLGDECTSPEFSVAYNGGTTAEGMKEYTVTVVCTEKYFYTGVVTMATEEEEEEG